MAISRRLFIGAGLGALVLRPRLRPVCVFMRGGADGWSMLVPHGQAAYYDLRRSTAIPQSDVCDLGGGWGLHPALEPLCPYWRNGRLQIRTAAMQRGRLAHATAQAHVTALLRETDVTVLDVWGWDTHFNQGGASGSLTPRLRRLAHRVDALAREGRTVFTISEFGRTQRENSIGGTDHAPHVTMLRVGPPTASAILHEPIDLREAIHTFLAD